MKNIYLQSSKLQSMSLTNSQIELINSIEYEKSKQSWTVQRIVGYIEKGYPIDPFVKNYTEIVKLGKDSSSLRSCILRYGTEIGTQLFNEKSKACSITFERISSTHGTDYAKTYFQAHGASLENYIARHGNDLGSKKWNEYLEKRKKSYAKKRQSGHQYPKYNLEYYVNLHGEEKGSSIYYAKINSQRHKVSLAYYIEQFGPVDGPKRCKKAKDHGSLKYFVNKYGEDLGHIKYEEKCVASAKQNTQRYSNMSKELFDAVKEIVVDLVYYGERELVWAVPAGALPQQAVCPDLFYKGRIIEFNGDVFHANPAMFKASDTPHPFRKNLTAKEIQDLDAGRHRYFESKGYQVLIIWESEWKVNKQKTIAKCVEFLTK